MSLKARIQEDMKASMRAADKPRLAAIRMALASINQREIDERTTLDDTQTIAVIEKMIKQRRESITQFKAGNRNDLADKEQFEIEVLQAYLPEPLSEAELDQLVAAAIKATGASSMRDMGKVMSRVKSEAQGRADMAAVSAKVKASLSS